MTSVFFHQKASDGLEVSVAMGTVLLIEVITAGIGVIHHSSPDMMCNFKSVPELSPEHLGNSFVAFVSRRGYFGKKLQ